MKKDKLKIKWLLQPQDHNYPAALSYLSLSYNDAAAASLVEQLKAAPISSFRSKDIFRASSLSLLGISNLHVKKDRDKIKAGIALSPILLVRNAGLAKVIIADGYHRLCAVYSIDEYELIPCKIV